MAVRLSISWRSPPYPLRLRPGTPWRLAAFWPAGQICPGEQLLVCLLAVGRPMAAYQGPWMRAGPEFVVDQAGSELHLVRLGCHRTGGRSCHPCLCGHLDLSWGGGGGGDREGVLLVCHVTRLVAGALRAGKGHSLSQGAGWLPSQVTQCSRSMSDSYRCEIEKTKT